MPNFPSYYLFISLKSDNHVILWNGIRPHGFETTQREYRLIKVKQHLENKIKREKYNLLKDEINLKKRREGLLIEFEKRSKDRKSVTHIIFLIIILLSIIAIIKIAYSLRTFYFNVSYHQPYPKEQVLSN
jgi:hypothetical protein